MKEKLYRAILRSEHAYTSYLEHRQYVQALRIYKANQEVYTLLTEYLYSCEEQLIAEVIQYLFHLEDWFEQFHAAQVGKKLEDLFVFQRLENGIAYPKGFKDYLLD